jgi:hypothetical protein
MLDRHPLDVELVAERDLAMQYSAEHNREKGHQRQQVKPELRTVKIEV